MTTENLYEFLILSKTLNYSKAAENLYISQSVLSKHIQQMEAELQTSLFHRNTHGITLTEAGVLLAQKAKALIDQCDTAVNLLHAADMPASGTIRIACALELSYAAHIQIFVGRFMERYPHIQVDLTVCSEGTPESLLADSDYDFIFTPCEYLNLTPPIHAHLLQSHGTYVAVYPGHPLLSKSLIPLKALSGETIIVPFADEFFGPYAQNWLLVQKYTHEKNDCIKVPNLSTALFLVSAGRGIAIVPRYAKNFAAANIFMIGLSNEECRFNEYFYYIERAENDAAKLFYEEFQRECTFSDAGIASRKPPVFAPKS